MCGLLLAPHFIFAAVSINEVLFDPVGTDTGLEKIELYNSDATSVDVSGWELYPDGIGYFVFPSAFSLPAKSFLTIHLRSSGADNPSNLYHPAPTTNMGNSSGSLALFKPGGRSKDTIVDFMRYHKPGSSERKTWESAAGEAGLWTSGAFIDIFSPAEGNSLGLAGDGIRGSVSAWRIYAVPSIGGSNGEAGVSPPPAPPATSTPPAPSAGAGEPPRPSLGADAGSDATVVAGSVVQFQGLAFGLDGEPLSTARFLWNFGDGALGQGRAVTHTYYFPGTYRANLSVSSGEYAGSDWKSITVLAPAIIVSEVKPGSNGFVELFNAAEAAVDLAGMSLADEKGKVFYIPSATTVGAASAIVFPHAISGLDPVHSLVLRDASARILDQASFSRTIDREMSWERMDKTFVVTGMPTPGKFSSSPTLASKPAPSSPGGIPNASRGSEAPRPLPSEPSRARVAAGLPETEKRPGIDAVVIEPPSTSAGARATIFPNISSGTSLLAASLLGGLLLAVAFFFLKRTFVS